MTMTKRELETKWQYDESEELDTETFEKISRRRTPPALMSTRQLCASAKTAASRCVKRKIGRQRGNRRNKRYS